MSFSTPALDLAGMFEVARRYGYDGIEPRLDSGHAHGIEVAITVEQRKAIRGQVDASGIALACLATSLTYADPAKTADMIRQTIERIDLAGDLGVPAIRVFGGRIPEGVTRDQAVDLLVRSLAEAADHAKQRGVTVCIETHDDWCDPANIAAVLQRINHASIAANWDIMHPVRSANVSMDTAFQVLKPWIRHLHIHDGTKADGKLAPIGTGDMDHRRALELLTEIDYDGFVSGEWINWEPYDVHLPRELAAMKRYEAELA
jgi:sugar phosphate isomerase/epimerase